MPKLSSDSDDDHEGPHEDNVEEVVSTREVVKDEPKVNGDAVKTQPCDRQLRDWHDGLCSCHKDVGNCFLVAFCPSCAAAYEFYKHNENPILGFCFFGPLMALVAQYRAKNGIMGSLCTDCLTTYFCGSCMLCRLHRDFEHLSD